MPLLLRQRLKSIPFGTLLLELVIVFVGVYGAFELNNYREGLKQVEDRQRLTELMRVGIDRYGKLFEGFSQYHAKNNPPFLEELQAGDVPFFGDNYFPAPQYPIDLMRHIMTRESYDIFDVEVNVTLASFLAGIERIMYTEEKLVELSRAYTPLPDATHADYVWEKKRQLHLARRYFRYLETRRLTAAHLAQRATELDALLTSKL